MSGKTHTHIHTRCRQRSCSTSVLVTNVGAGFKVHTVLTACEPLKRFPQAAPVASWYGPCSVTRVWCENNAWLYGNKPRACSSFASCKAALCLLPCRHLWLHRLQSSRRQAHAGLSHPRQAVNRRPTARCQAVQDSLLQQGNKLTTKRSFV